CQGPGGGGAAALALWAALGCLGKQTPPVRRETIGRFGEVRIYPCSADCLALVFLISDAGGWSDDLDRIAEKLRRRGAAVAGIDLKQYLAGLIASDDGCHCVICEIEQLSKTLQRDLSFDRYASPVLIGMGAGGVFAYAAVAQAPAATIAGAVSVHPGKSLATRVPFCPGAPATRVTGGYEYGVHASLPG